MKKPTMETAKKLANVYSFFIICCFCIFVVLIGCYYFEYIKDTKYIYILGSILITNLVVKISLILYVWKIKKFKMNYYDYSLVDLSKK